MGNVPRGSVRINPPLLGPTLITFIIVPAVNNRSAPGQKHSHRWESPSCHWIGPRKFSNCLMVGKVGVLEDGLLGCCFRGVPGGYFWAIFGAPDGTITPGRNDYKRFRGTFTQCLLLGFWLR